MKILFTISFLATIVLSAARECSGGFPGTITFAGDDHADLFMCGAHSIYRSNFDVQTFTPGRSCSEIYLKVENTGLSSGFAMAIRSSSTGQEYVTTIDPISTRLQVRVTYDNIDNCLNNPSTCSSLYWRDPVYVSSLYNAGPFVQMRSRGALPLGVQNGNMASITYGVWIQNPFCFP